MDMTSASPALDLALEVALRTAILADPTLARTLNGVYDAAPVQAREPFVRIGDAFVSPWAAKGFAGQEVRLSIVIHDDARARDRAARLADALCAAIDAMDAGIEGGRVVLKQMQRLRAGRRSGGQAAGTGWLVVTDWRFLVERA